MANPDNQSQYIDDFDDDLLDDSAMSADIDTDFDMLSEDELNALFDDAELEESDELLPEHNSFSQHKKNGNNPPLPDHLKDFDFGDDDFDDF